MFQGCSTLHPVKILCLLTLCFSCPRNLYSQLQCSVQPLEKAPCRRREAPPPPGSAAHPRSGHRHVSGDGVGDREGNVCVRPSPHQCLQLGLVAMVVNPPHSLGAPSSVVVLACRSHGPPRSPGWQEVTCEGEDTSDFWVRRPDTMCRTLVKCSAWTGRLF